MIIAGIVTYQPELERLRENLSGIAPQVDAVLIYDNGSSNAVEIADLVAAWDAAHLYAGTENIGVASALNRLSSAAVELGADWLLTLDQDSVCSAGMVKELRRVATDRVAIAAPYIVDRNKLTVEDYNALVLPSVEHFSQAARRGAITSGALVRLAVWAEVGGYDDRFFIDYVDYDFNQRVLNAGYVIVRANRTYLLHEVGRAAKTWLRVPRKTLSGTWQLERFYAFGHNPMRCYYKARNRVLFTRKHGRTLGVTHEGIWQLPQQMALTLLFEDKRMRKLLAFVRGIRDGARLPLT